MIEIISTESIPKLALHYLNSPADTLCYTDQNDFKRWIFELYEKLEIKIDFVKGQPYSSMNDLAKDYHKKNIRVSTDFNNCPYLGQEINLFHRAVHDCHHVQKNAKFDWYGEQVVCAYTSSLTNRDIFYRILRSDLVYLLAAQIYLGRFPEGPQKLILSDP